MKENAFVRAVNKPLPKDVHHQGMSAGGLGGTGGTPDHYYDFKRDFWVEFKVADTFGNAGYNIGGMLSALQTKWLNRRFEIGGNCCVIVGVPSNKTRGFVVDHPDQWASRVHKDFFIPRLMYAPELAAYILSRVS